MAKYSEKLVEKIVTFIEKDCHSISEICNILRISRKTSYEWRKEKPEFAEAIEGALQYCEDRLVVHARISLHKKVEGHTLTEVKTTYIPDKDDPSQLKIKSKVVKTKEYAPDTSSIKLVLERNDRRAEKQHSSEMEKKPFQIIVDDQKAADQILLLKERLSGKYSESQKLDLTT